MDKYLKRRIARAYQVEPGDVKINAVTPLEKGDRVLVSGKVQSQSGDGAYKQSVTFDLVSTRLVEGRCTCPDCGETKLPAVGGVRGVIDFCKHLGAVALAWKEDREINSAAEKSLAQRFMELGLEWG